MAIGIFVVLSGEDFNESQNAAIAREKISGKDSDKHCKEYPESQISVEKF